MVTLRIWNPSSPHKFKAGSSALTIDGVWGTDHISTRPIDPKSANARTGRVRVGGSQNTTLEEDIKDEGGDTRHIWRFKRMDESRMLRLWGSLKERVAEVEYAKYDPASSFRVSDLILAAGCAIDVESQPVAGFADRARGQAFSDAVATSFVQLRARAEYLAQVAHW